MVVDSAVRVADRAMLNVDRSVGVVGRVLHIAVNMLGHEVVRVWWPIEEDQRLERYVDDLPAWAFQLKLDIPAP
ncbi:MAG: hypothetical protein IT307_14770 [Chloroflexi bacterium]|nr:hypothetical protein [Chloroflexota bacterium]